MAAVVAVVGVWSIKRKLFDCKHSTLYFIVAARKKGFGAKQIVEEEEEEGEEAIYCELRGSFQSLLFPF